MTLVKMKAHKGHPLNKAEAGPSQKGLGTSGEYPYESLNASHEEDMQVTPWPMQQKEDEGKTLRPPMKVEEAITRRAKSGIHPG